MWKPTNRRIKTVVSIARTLALEKESSLDELAEKTSKSYTTILRRVKEMKRVGYVKLDRMESTDAKGKERRIYRITLRGLIPLSLSKFFWENIDTIAQNHGTLLLTFAEWDSFVKAGFRDLVVKRLREGFMIDAPLSTFLGVTLNTYFGAQVDRTTEEEKLQNHIDSNVFGIHFLTFPFETNEIEKERDRMLAFWCLLKANRRIASWISLELERLRIMWESELGAIGKAKEFWESL